MTRNVISVICYVVAGFIANSAGLGAFINLPPAGNMPVYGIKWGMVGVMMALGAVALGTGLLLSRFRNWKRDTGIVLLSASAMIAVDVLMGVCLYFSPEFTKVKSNSECLSKFSDIYNGSGCLVIFALTGVLLILASRRKRPDVSQR